MSRKIQDEREALWLELEEVIAGCEYVEVISLIGDLNAEFGSVGNSRVIFEAGVRVGEQRVYVENMVAKQTGCVKKKSIKKSKRHKSTWIRREGGKIVNSWLFK